jgi:hypothetical protein
MERGEREKVTVADGFFSNASVTILLVFAAREHITMDSGSSIFHPISFFRD